MTGAVVNNAAVFRLVTLVRAVAQFARKSANSGMDGKLEFFKRLLVGRLNPFLPSSITSLLSLPVNLNGILSAYSSTTGVPVSSRMSNVSPSEKRRPIVRSILPRADPAASRFHRQGATSTEHVARFNTASHVLPTKNLPSGLEALLPMTIRSLE